MWFYPFVPRMTTPAGARFLRASFVVLLPFMLVAVALKLAARGVRRIFS